MPEPIEPKPEFQTVSAVAVEAVAMRLTTENIRATVDETRLNGDGGA